MTRYRKLAGDKCYLAPTTVEDAEKWVEWFNDLAVAIPLGDEAYSSITLENQQALAHDLIEMGAHSFSIVDLTTDCPIGRCLLFSVDQVNRSAMLGICIGEKRYWGKGYGREAVQLLLDYAFNLLNLNSVMLGTFSFNERAIRCFREAGFEEIGRRRQARIIGDKRYDLVLMDVLAEELGPSLIQGFVEDIERE